MFDIIANKTNSLDVDKIDYLQRDAVHLGILTVGFNQQRLLQGTRIIDNRLCYNSKIYNEVEQVFMTRYKLFKECYSHRVCKAIDYMIVDALTEANPVFHFEQTINDPARYVDVTDNYLTHIESSKNPALATSRALLKRIRQRDLYRFLSEKILVDKQQVEKCITAEEIVGNQDVSKFYGIDLRPEDIIVNVHSLNWGMKAKNPVEAVPFYKSEYNLGKRHHVYHHHYL
jgi:HD superfamily phosphohydrolase